MTSYSDGYDGDPTLTEPTLTYFWNVLTSFTQEERVKYLKFVWGRSRLSDLTNVTHTINLMQGTEDVYPQSHTCSFELDLPIYTSEKVCRERLLFAINHATIISEEDETMTLPTNFFV